MINFLQDLKDKINFFRVGIVAFYLAIFFAVLYLPELLHNFQKQEELNICTFADLISFDAKFFERFTQETGVKVNVKYCELDSEMLSQLVASGGTGLDLITPTDIIVAQLLKLKLLQKQDKGLLTKEVVPHDLFLKKEFDPNLDYCIPFAWTHYSIGYNKKFFDNFGVVPNSLQAVFEPNKFFDGYPGLLQNYKVAIFEDSPQELLLLGGLYLYDDVSVLKDPQKMRGVVNLYGDHKNRWLYAYISANMFYYLSSVVPVVLSFNSTLKSLIEEDGENYGVACPVEGSVLVPQNFCIPSGAKNVAQARKLIDFFMRDEILEEIFDTSGYIPADKKMLNLLRDKHRDLGDLIPDEHLLEKMVPVNDLLTSREVEQGWLAVKCVQ